jgi:hypothetical protein
MKMRSLAILLAALKVATATQARADGAPSTFALLGRPESLGAAVSGLEIELVVSLNPVPLVLGTLTNLDLNDPTLPTYSSTPPPTFEIVDFSFDIEQVLSVGSSGGGAGEGKVSFNSFQITGKTATSVVGDFTLVGVTTGAVLGTFEVTLAGINPNTFVTPPCGPVPCTSEAFTFAGIGPDPTASFNVRNGSRTYAFSIVPEPSTWAMMGLGFAALGFAWLSRAPRPTG